MHLPHSLHATIASTWDGQTLPSHAHTHLSLTDLSPQDAPHSGDLQIRIDAPFYDDPAPPHAIGAMDGLWEFEVVEIFISGTADAAGDIPYLEIELSPHGHFLVLQLRGVRKRIGTESDLEYKAQIDGARWQGEARIPRAWLPVAPLRWNAYAIHGVGAQRQYLAMSPPLGEKPDFHRLESFVALA